MIEMTGNIFDMALDPTAPPTILLVTTNGCWDAKGNAVMGAGFAKAVKELFPKSAETLGMVLRIQYEKYKDRPRADVEEPWNLPYRIAGREELHVFSFPTKPTKVTVAKGFVLPRYFSQRQVGMRIEGWKSLSLLPLIERSAKYIASLVGDPPSLIERVLLPRVGTMNGKLDWESQVKPVLDKYFDSRYTVVERE